MRIICITVCALLITGCAGNSEVEGERVSEKNGIVHVCGEGHGLPECRDYNNLTYSENLKYKAPTDKQMEDEASKLRAESPEELERSISELEQNPERIDSMAE